MHRLATRALATARIKAVPEAASKGAAAGAGAAEAAAPAACMAHLRASLVRLLRASSSTTTTAASSSGSMRHVAGSSSCNAASSTSPSLLTRVMPPCRGQAPQPQSFPAPLARRLLSSSSAPTSTSTPQPPIAKPVPPTFLETARKLLPGTALSVAVMVFGSWVADIGGSAFMATQGLSGPSPISGVPLAILTGAFLNNTLSLPQATLAPGLRFCSKTLLQAGIVCVGAKISFAEVAALGAAGLPVVAAAITSGLVSVIWLNSRLGLPPRLGLLTAAGTSICGVTAITALAPAIQANQQEVAYAVANVVAFGLFGMLVYPYLAHQLMQTSEQVGLFLGTAIHDTSQVMGAALTYSQMYQDEVALKVAAVTKLTRNLGLVFVIPLLAALNARSSSSSSTAASPLGAPSAFARLPLTTLFPPFILGFLALAALRSLGDATDAFNGALGGDSPSLNPLSPSRPPTSHSSAASSPDSTDPVAATSDDKAAAAAIAVGKQRWKSLTNFVGSTASGSLLGTAMAAVGLSTSFAVFKGVGMRPFAVGLAGACTVGLTGFTMARLMGGNVHF